METIWVFYAYGSSDAPVDISEVASGEGRQAAIENGVGSAVEAYLSGGPRRTSWVRAMANEEQHIAQKR